MRDKVQHSYIQPVAVTLRRRLRSTSSSALVVLATRRTTIVDRTFAGPVHGTVLLNSSPTARFRHL